MKQKIYKVLYLIINNGQSEWVEKQVKTLHLNEIGVDKVETVDGEIIVIDNISAFLREFVGMFDKKGQALFSDDIVKFPFDLPTEEVPNPEDVMGVISFINGAYCIPLPEKEAVVYLTQQNVQIMEKLGNVHQNAQAVEKEVDESVFNKKEEVENSEEKSEIGVTDEVSDQN